jgi:EAL domain-containing protein (putative c-di-GMP-specific phosphodiesterase class I)
MDLREDAPRLLGDLKRLGIALAMDDFGTGYSSLAYLKGLPFDTLKIDRSFIGGLPDDAASAAIVTAITTLGNSLGFDVLAEGVETEAQRRFLLAAGCRRAQGYLFSPPVPPEAVALLVS